MKRKITIIALTVLMIALSVGGSLAYFTQEEIVHNIIITTGSIDIELIEKSVKDGREVDFQDVSGVIPGTSVSKIVTAENTGASDAFVRVSVEIFTEFADGTKPPSDPAMVSLDYNTKDWTLGADGYWYYNSVLEPGKVTEALFTAVSFSPAMGNEYQSSIITVDVAVQAVQSANNGTDALDASGWPA